MAEQETGTKVLTGGISEDVKRQDLHQCMWELTVIIGDEVRTVGYPLTIDFNISRNTSANANNAQFNIYNLAPATRHSEFFFQDKFNTAKRKTVIFKAGYNNNLIEIFKGYILECYSRRNGSDIVTNMQCLDMGNTTDYVNQTFQAGTTYVEVVENLAKACKDLKIENIGALDGTIQHPLMFQGTVMECINQICGGSAFCDNSRISILQPNEAIDVGVSEIRAETGLLGTPERRDGEVVIDSIFRPEIVVGQLLHITSTTSSEFDGTYKVAGITHSGIISGSQGGQRKTQFNLFIGSQLPNGVGAVTGSKQKTTFSKVKGKQKITPVNGKIGSDVYSVYKYIQDHNGQPPKTYICEGITWKDMLLPNTSEPKNTPAQVKKEIKVEYLQNCKVIAEKLRRFVNSKWGHRRINISSGWRSTETNNALRNASKGSAHLRGLAIDFNVEGFNCKYAWSVFNRYWDKFTYPMFKYGNIHVQATYGEGGAKRMKGY